jgi:hypothetical protein
MYFGKTVKNSKSEELCDIYIRQKNNIALIEFKDVLLSADVKNSADTQKVFNEFDKKFWENQAGKPKGVRQLLNAIVDIENNGVKVETFDSLEKELYPIVLYTDNSFGLEGLNKIYKQKMQKELMTQNVKTLTVHEVTFINLNYFEVMQDYFTPNLINLFTIIREYHTYTKNEDYSKVSFEVFSRHYMNEHVTTQLEGSSFFKEILPEIIKA